MYGEPLVVNGQILVATENNSVYALSPRGRILWRRHLGAPVDQSTLPCGDIDPLGITGTPVYDPRTGRLFAAAELANPIRHRLFALNPSTGHVAWSHRLDPRRMHQRTQQQWAALAIANSRVWLAFGGLAGDCGKYHGWAIGARTRGGRSSLSRPRRLLFPSYETPQRHFTGSSIARVRRRRAAGMADQLRLEQWWTALTTREQRTLVHLRTGDVLPLALYPLLYGFIDAHATDKERARRSSLAVPPALGDFLAAKRDEARDRIRRHCTTAAQRKGERPLSSRSLT